MTEADIWPDPSFHIGQRDHLHALGAIIATYNMLEFALFVMFKNALRLPDEHARRLFILLNNHNRIELIKDAALTLNHRDAIIHFVDGFSILTNTRNFLAHSMVIQNTTEQAHLTFGKGSKRNPGELSFTHLTLDEIREIADQMKAFWLYGSHIAASIAGVRHLPELAKPPLPIKMKEVSYGALD